VLLLHRRGLPISQIDLQIPTLTAASALAMSCSRKVSFGSSSPSATIGMVGPSCESL